ncbi:MAG: integrase arm-type DNA-binding domain-containing protein [Pseudomonadota bacterium]
MKLTTRQIKSLDSGKYQDGNGLALHKRDQNRGKWIFRFSLNGKRSEMGLGPWPNVSLADARQKASEARDLVRQGANPIAERKSAAFRQRGVPTLKECIYAAYEARKASLRGEGKSGRWLSPLELHVIPVIGELPVTEVDQNAVASALRPIWRSKYPTADKAASRTNTALEYAVAQGHDVNLNAVKMARILLGDPGHKVRHHPAMPWQELPAFYQSLGAGSAVRRVLAFMILTGGGARTAPVRLARYDEIHGEQWMIPAEKMKGREGQSQDFRIPLNEPALELMETCRRLTGGEWLFPGPRGKPITDVNTSAFMRDAGLPFHPHGFRSSFRDWMAHIEVPFETAETAIAHRIGNKVTRAYLRDDYWEQRKVIMNRWGNHLLGKGSAKLIDLQRTQ